MPSLLAFFPVIEALLALAISIVLFKKWWSTADKSTKFWSWAFFFHFCSYLIAGFFVSRLVVLQIVQYFLLQFARQTFESLLFLSVYFGIINLLTTKRSLTFTLPFLFFVLQEFILLYFDFFIKDLRIADQLHIVFFDIPFNILVALLFWKYYQVSKKRYSALISGGWLLYAVFVPIFFYTEGNVLLYTISLSHMVMMFVGFVLLYESPTGQAILEISPAVERKLSTAMKYQLKPGKTYLVEEEKPEKSYDIFMDAVLHGIRGLIITRTKPELVQQKFQLQITPVMWLTHVHTPLPSVDPSELEQFIFLVDKFVIAAKEQALTEGEAEVKPKVEVEVIEKISKPPEIPKEKLVEAPPVEVPKEAPKEEKPKPEEEWKQKMKETIAEAKEISKKPVVLEEAAAKPLKEAVKEAEKAEEKSIRKGIMLVFEEEPAVEKKEEKAEPTEEKKAEIVMKKEEAAEAKSERKAESLEVLKAGKKEEVKGEVLQKEQVEEKKKEEEKPDAIEEKKVEVEPKEKSEEKRAEEKKEVDKNELVEDAKKEEKIEEEKADEAKKVEEVKIEKPVEQKEPRGEEKSVQDLAEKPLKELVKEAEKMGGVEIKGKPSGGGVEIKRGKMLILDDEDEKKDVNTKASFILAAGDVSGTGLNKSIVMIDGFEYLVSNNTFTAVLHMLQTLKDKISMGESMLIIPVNPKCLDEKELSMLRMEFETYVEEKED